MKYHYYHRQQFIDCSNFEFQKKKLKVENIPNPSEPGNCRLSETKTIFNLIYASILFSNPKLISTEPINRNEYFMSENGITL